jgi:hypothetical protein
MRVPLHFLGRDDSLAEIEAALKRISRAGSRSSCPSNHASRAAFTSPRCCSAACADFFKCDAPPVEEASERPDAGADAARLQLLLKLDERDIRCLGDGDEDIIGGLCSMSASP